jgi:DNA-binding SARP family transcriptional activator
LWQIRRSLQVEDLAQHILLTEGDTVQLHPSLPLLLDVEEFAKCSPQRAVTGLEHVERGRTRIALYQGDFMAGYYADWVLSS